MGLIPVPGLHGGYLQIAISAFTMHNQSIPVVPAAPNVPGIIETPGFMAAPGGFLGAKLARTVFFDGSPAVQEGHDIGFFIPHIAAPLNILMAVHTLLSKHKVFFPVSSVQIEGKPMGVYALLFIPGEICANPVSLPTGVVLLFKGTILSSISLADIAAGLWTLAKDVALDMVWNKLTSGNAWGTGSTNLTSGANLLGRMGNRIFRPSPQVLEGLGRTFSEMIRAGGARGVLNVTARTLGGETLDAIGSKILKDYVWEKGVLGL